MIMLARRRVIVSIELDRFRQMYLISIVIFHPPNKALIIRGLDALTAEETVTSFLNSTSNTTLPIKNCLIARDSFTKVSMGFCFVEMTSIQVRKKNVTPQRLNLILNCFLKDAGYMLQLLQPCFEIDGKQVVANYSKNSFKTA